MLQSWISFNIFNCLLYTSLLYELFVNIHRYFCVRARFSCWLVSMLMYCIPLAHTRERSHTHMRSKSRNTKTKVTEKHIFNIFVKLTKIIKNRCQLFEYNFAVTLLTIVYCKLFVIVYSFNSITKIIFQSLVFQTSESA